MTFNYYPSQTIYMNRFTVFKRFNSVVSNLLDKCHSCGIALQLKTPTKPGFIPIIRPKPFEKYEDKVYQKYLSKLNPEDLQLLNAGNHDNRKPAESHDHSHTKECLRCRNLKYKSQAPEVEEIDESIMDQINDIHDAKMIHVVNGVEFPFGINANLMHKHKPLVVITKSDLIYHDEKQAAKFPLFKEYVHKQYGIPMDDIFLVSNSKGWGLAPLHKHLQNMHLSSGANLQIGLGKYFLVGDINSGKSSLISRLLFLNKADSRLSFHKWNQKNGPGISNYPGFTRGSLNYGLSQDTTDGYQLIDLPGLNNFQLPGFKQFKNVFKQTKIYKKGTHSAEYNTFSNRQVLTVGGLFYIQNQGLIVQYKNMINHDATLFRDIAKLDDIASTYPTNKSLHHKFLVPPVASPRMKTYIIPPFWGTVDLVIKNFGYIELKVTGSKSTNQLLEVMVPETFAADMIIRRPLAQYVFKTLSGRDKRGNPLSKPNQWKSTKVIRTFNPKQPFSSRLIPKIGSQWESVTKATGVEYNDRTEITPDLCYNYWHM